MTIIDTTIDPVLFAAWFAGKSWSRWKAAMRAVFALEMSDEDLETYSACTGRTTPPVNAAREAWFIVGRRGGKSRIAALVAVYLACFRRYDDVLAPGEMGTVMLLASDRRQARVLLRYINGFLDAVPMLRRMVFKRTRETIELNNRIIVEVHTASRTSTRGYTLIAAIGDETAFWPSDELGANPDVEVLNALRPGLATVPGALLLCISSPYARRGALWEAYRRHYSKDGDPVLVWQADTRTMNPLVDEAIIAAAYEQDEASASAEYGAQFRRDIESFIGRETVEACVVPGRRELPPMPGIQYFAFVDPSGGSGADSMTLAISHREKDGRAVLDCVRERRPPFSPSETCIQFSEILKSYRCSTVTGDRWGGEFPREILRAQAGANYVVAEKTRSDFYRDLLPLLNSGRVELLDERRLVNQICSLERRTARSGKDSIGHAPGAHDDLANAAAGALVLAAQRPVQVRMMRVVGGY